MRRLFSTLLLAGLAGSLLAVPASATATQLPPRSAQVTGKLTSVGGYEFTVQTPGRATGVLNALTTAATRLGAEDYPYVWGGGHGQAGIASVGDRGGPGANGRRRGYDCSGSVAAVLEAAGLWPAGASVPNDAGVVQYLLSHKLIARGAGTGPREVTLYDHPGVHIFMNIDGRFFGTSDGGGGGDTRGGPGWLDDGAWDAHSAAFRRYHVVPGALKATTNAGYTFAFQFGPDVSVPAGLPANTKVRVAYRTTNAGTMVAQAIMPVGELTAVGTIQSIAANGSSFTVLTESGMTLSFPVVAGSPVLSQLLGGQIELGAKVSLTYLGKPTLLLLGVTVLVPPTPTAAIGTVKSTAANGSSFTILTESGKTLTFPIPAGSPVVGELLGGQIATGDTVSLAFLGKPPAKLSLVSVTVTATPPPTTSTTTTTTTTSPTPPSTATQTPTRTPAAQSSGGTGF